MTTQTNEMANPGKFVAPERVINGRRLGRGPARANRKALHFASFAPRLAAVDLPRATDFWPKRVGFTNETWGNDVEGCCTIAGQANMFRRFERLEQRRTITIETAEVHRVYRTMTAELYGDGTFPGPDVGAYATDALDVTRRADKTIRDYKGRPLLIDAYVRLNPKNPVEIKQAIWTAAGRGIAVCLDLPLAFGNIEPPRDWDLPAANFNIFSDYQYTPGGWGGHFQWATDYDGVGIWLDHTWGIERQRLTWDAAMAYLAEAFLVVDRKNDWSRQRSLAIGSPSSFVTPAHAEAVAGFDIDALETAVNDVSSVKIGQHDTRPRPVLD
jgi:hypothetical protein